MRRWLPWLGLAVLLGVAACVFQPDLTRFPRCDEQGACATGWTCLASEKVCLPDCGERGPCTVEVPSEVDASGSDAGTDGGDPGTPDAGPTQLVLAPDAPGMGTETASYLHRFQASGGTAPYSFSLTAGEPPPGLTLNAQGELSGKPTAAGDFHFTVEVVDQGATPQHVQQEFSVRVRPVLRLAGPGVLAYYVSGSDYVERLSAHGGKSPYKFELVSGSLLPAGIVLRESGQVDGKTSEESTTPPFDVRVTDSDDPPQTAIRRLQLTATSCPSLSICIRSSAVPDARVGTPYTYTLQSSPSSSSWSVVDKSKLPPGISFTGDTAVLSGTPTQPGSYEFTVSVSGGLLGSDQKTLTLFVFP